MAIYFRKINTVYIHFPRTGGVSLYSMLKDHKIGGETKGYQHSPVDMLGKEVWINKPKVWIFSREEESWFRSYWEWRDRNKNDDYRLPGEDAEHWHPKWVLEDLFDRDYEQFMRNIKAQFPGYYKNLCMRYYEHPTFNIQIFKFEDLAESWQQMFAELGIDKPLEYFQKYPRLNSAK